MIFGIYMWLHSLYKGTHLGTFLHNNPISKSWFSGQRAWLSIGEVLDGPRSTPEILRKNTYIHNNYM